MLYKHGRQIVEFLVIEVACEDQVGSVGPGAEVYGHAEWRKSKRGALCLAKMLLVAFQDVLSHFGWGIDCCPVVALFRIVGWVSRYLGWCHKSGRFGSADNFLQRYPIWF
jgi:hypothetical protein